jgi:Spy/CpxP family protein refolding chaperone
MRSTLLATALVLAASATLAQQAPAPAAATRPAWMGPGLVEYLAANPADLNLTRDQQNRIRQAKETLDRAMTPLRDRIRGIRANQAWGNITVDQRRALADTTRQLAEQVHASHLAALDAVNATLTAEQKTTLEARRESMRGGRMHPGMMGPGMGRQMGRGMGQQMGRGMRMHLGMGGGAACGAPMNPEMGPPQRMDTVGRPPRGGRWEE